jgi:hypothetical protein
MDEYDKLIFCQSLRRVVLLHYIRTKRENVFVQDLEGA